MLRDRRWRYSVSGQSLSSYQLYTSGTDQGHVGPRLSMYSFSEMVLSPMLYSRRLRTRSATSAGSIAADLREALYIALVGVPP